MRQVVLNIETTGVASDEGHRIIELAGVELIDQQPTGCSFHRYFNPEREINPETESVHGLSAEFLAVKPVFSAVAGELVEFIRGANLVAHNAPFDICFLDYELTLAGLPTVDALCPDVFDTLSMARERFPGQRNDLNSLCERFGIDGARYSDSPAATMDAHCLTDVYRLMCTEHSQPGNPQTQERNSNA